MQTPANFIRLRSLSFDAAIAGSARLCEVKDGFLIIPVVDTDEALTIIGKLGELPNRAQTPKPEPTAPNPLQALDQTVEKLRGVADALDGKVSKPSAAPVAAESGPRVLKDDEPVFKPNGTTAPAVNAPGASDEPPAAARGKVTEKPADKKGGAKGGTKPTRNVVDDVAAQEAAPAEPPKEEPAAASKEPEAAPAPEEQEENGSAPSGFNEGYISAAPKLRDIVVHMYESGLKTVDGIIAELSKRKEHPLVGKAVITSDRIERMLDAVGITPGA